MTIEEELRELKAQNLVKLNRIHTLERYIKAKESDLKGALIIPEGWEVSNFWKIHKTRSCGVRLYNGSKGSVTGRGFCGEEALRNALEQIENTKN